MRKWIGVLSLLLMLGAGATPAPPRPGPNAYVADYAHLLSFEQKANLIRLVGEQNARSDAHLFVVTVERLKARDVQEAAKACFSEWELGEADVLLFLSASERQARIHLGVNWSSRWDMEMRRILRDAVVPACEQGDCGRALMDGSQRLLAVTGAGPSASLPARTWLESLENLGATASSRTGFSWQMCLVFMGGGVVLILCSLLPIGTGPRLFAATLGLVMLVSCYSAQGVLSAFWVVGGLGILWVAGSLIQAGYQAGARFSQPDSSVNDYGSPTESWYS
ncbi:MAG: TPM domain-containing protein [Candidatus Eremiobacteraeota bacterium]|nr:TPM domain-containing protein [Candidatus Eremiobacteraeota bacterium]MCW5869603.1 TPM domain-containing protein [Candidatus Eremiobacteraeota bacterium]